MGRDFFDSFDTNTVLSPECVSQLDEKLKQEAASGSSPEAAYANYQSLLSQLLAAQGSDVQKALQDNPGFIYLEAAVDLQQFQSLLEQVAAAAQCASKAATDAAEAKAMGKEVKGSWEPPAEDADPETAQDYE